MAIQDSRDEWRERGAGYAGRAAEAVNEGGNVSAATVNALLAIYCELRRSNEDYDMTVVRPDGM